MAMYGKYWSQVENHLSDLESKMGKVNRIYHELIPAGGEDGIKAKEELNDRSYQIIKDRLEKGASLEETEDREILTEFMDWNKCLFIGLQNQKVFTQICEYYSTANKRRNEYIA
ncbi:hypothetical protein ACFLUQ_00855 [Chloroflexota bacterium]